MAVDEAEAGGIGEQAWIAERKRFVQAGSGAGQAENGLADAGPLAREFAVLTSGLLTTGSVAEVLERVVTATRRVLPGADLVSITLRDQDGRFHTPVETAPAASEIDQAQYRSGRGPCVDSARAEGPALAVSGDLRTDDRWPEFAETAVRYGYHSVLATSLIPEAAPPHLPGALNVYARAADAFVPSDRDRMLLLSTHASLALATCQALTQAELKQTHLRRAIESRDLIGQAKGVLMTRRGLSAEEAFDVLRRTSQDLNIKLVDLARTVTEDTTLLDGA